MEKKRIKSWDVGGFGPWNVINRNELFSENLPFSHYLPFCQWLSIKIVFSVVVVVVFVLKILKSYSTVSVIEKMDLKITIFSLLKKVLFMGSVFNIHRTNTEQV